MFIKTITVHGFKSYRDQTAVDPFSSGHNVIVGRNGSGKSNFFSAIRFVLSDQYTSMSREDRQRLLHEGTSTTTTLSAYVEIVFDNTDGRFPTNLPELYLRRTIGLKKDEYSLDKKSASKAEVMNLLESAGFSRSNPYYIVPQGRITHLTNISDRDRLGVLKDVAGTQVYEAKRAESTKIMEDTDAKREKIADLLSYIEKRLEELEEEKEQLKEFNKSDKERRCLEFALHQREVEEASAALDRVEEERRNDVHASNTKRKEFNQREAIVQQHEEALTTAKLSLSTTQLALNQYESDMADLVRARTELECVIEDFAKANENGEEGRKQVEEQLLDVEKRIEEATEKLDRLSAELDERIAEEREAKEKLDATQSKLQVLYNKQGRTQQFRTKAERDTYLTGEIKSLKAYEKTQQKRVDDLQKDINGAKGRFDEAAQRARQHNQEEQERRDKLRQMGEDVTKLKSEVDAMQEQKKELWREDGRLSQTVSNAKEQLQTNERALHGMMDKDTAYGLQSVKRISQRLKLDGVFGPLYELFEVSDKYKVAVETTAGNSLFHVVVDNEETASKLLDVMNKEKAGRVTFMPLNRLKSHNVSYPKADDAIPMIGKLKFDKAYIMAFEQVFGRTIICEELSTAAQYTRSHKLNAVTVEGDRADRKGALTGGYLDVRKSRLDAAKGVRRWREAYDADVARHSEVKQTLSGLDQRISTALGQIQVLEAKRRQILEGRQMAATQARQVASEEEEARDRVTRLEGMLEEAEAELRDAVAKRSSYEEELKSPLTQRLSDEELATLETLVPEVAEQKTELVSATSARQKASTERKQVELELNESLRRNREVFRSRLDDLEADAGAGVILSGEVELKKSELGNLERTIEQMQIQVEELQQTAEDLTAEISSINAQLDEAQAEQLENTRAIMRAQKNAERYLTKRQTLASRKQEGSEAVRDLGVLPDEAYTKYTDPEKFSMESVIKKLHKVNESLKKFAHINKKAFDQYNNFTRQRDDLLKRREELDASAESIQELIQTLDQRKDEAIERTFKQVSKYFEEVFETLVPAGKGVLIIQKKIDGYVDEESENNSNREKSEIDNYTGVSIKVSFNSKADEGQRIQQLSGGQKSLVALATVFAIQKCDPAPFYLFDEIDANLDAQYRTAVAGMIHTLSESAQFITTTFRAEMLAQADKFYGVYFDKQKVSTIHTIEKDEAYQFIENSANVGQL